MSFKIDNYLSFVIAIQYLVTSVQYFVQMFAPVGSSMKLAIALIFNSIIAILFFIIFKQVLERKFYFILITYTSTLIFVALNLIFYPENSSYIQVLLYDFLFLGLISFVYIYSIYDYSLLLKAIYKISFIVSILCILIYLIRVFILSNSSYNIYFSYLITFAILVNLNRYLYHKSELKILILVILNTLIVFHVGSRGSLLCIFTYIILSTLFQSKLSLFFRMISLSIISIVYLYYKEILSYVNELFQKFGIYSRTLTTLTKDTIYLSGRDLIYDNTILAIKDNYITGIGLAGDRLIHGTYSHNIVLEIYVTFGVFLGTFIILILLMLFIKGCIFNKDKYNKMLCIIYFSYTIPMLMVSRTLWTQIEFWILLALCIGSLKKKKNVKDLRKKENDANNNYNLTLLKLKK